MIVPSAINRIASTIATVLENTGRESAGNIQRHVQDLLSDEGLAVDGGQVQVVLDAMCTCRDVLYYRDYYALVVQ